MTPQTKGERVKFIRTQKGYTLDQMSSMTGISKGFLSGFENNKSDIGGEYLRKIADALQASLDYIYRGEPNPKSYQNEPVEIPKDLSDLAEEMGLTFKDTLTLLDIDNSIMARRSSKSVEAKTKEYWGKLFKAFKETMPIIGLLQINKGLKSIRGLR